MKRLLIGMLVLMTCVAQAAIRYLSTVGENVAPYDTPEKAARDLATVIGAASVGDEIRVLPGIYKPAADIAGKSVTLRSYDANGAVDAANTIFDGSDYAGNGPLLTFNEIDQANAPQFKGLTFRKFAKSVMSFNSMTGVRIEDCVFNENGGEGVNDGGALYFNLCKDAIFLRSTFVGNSAMNYGGAVCLTSSMVECNGIFEDCVFSTNGLERPMCGGAVYSNREVHFKNCRFDNNTTSMGSAKSSTCGGSVFVGGNSLVAGCLFTGYANAAYGKCLYTISSVVTNCHFTGVKAAANQNYGVIAMSSGMLTDCSVTDSDVYTKVVFANQAASTVGPLRVRNLLVANNVRHNSDYFAVFGTYKAGGGVVVDNCTILVPDGQIISASSQNGDRYAFSNCALVGKWPSNLGVVTYVTSNCTDVSTSTVEGLRFIDVAGGNYIPLSDSPLVNQGKTMDWHLNAVDLNGRPRAVGMVDIGCFERQPTDADYTIVRVVSSDAEKTGEWADATVGLQPAFDAVCGTVTRLLVKSGTYMVTETLQLTNVTTHVVSCGADGGPDRDGTILDAQGVRRILRIVPSENDSSGIPIYDRRVTFEGFTFKNGNTHAGDGQADAGLGGGLFLKGRAKASGKIPSRIVNCRFTACESDYGGAVAMEGGELIGCVFDGNLADVDEDSAPVTAIGGQGGAVGILSSVASSATAYMRAATWFAPGIIGCTFSNNTAEAFGAAIANLRRRVTGQSNSALPAYIADSTFEGHSLTWDGAAKRDYADGVCVSCLRNGLVTNCVFRNNGTSTIGYGVLRLTDGAHVADCTFTGNNGIYGSIYCSSKNDIKFDRCSFVDNKNTLRAFGMFRNCLFAAPNVSIPLFRPEVTEATTTFENCTFVSSPTQNAFYFPASKTNLLEFVGCILYQSSTNPLFGEVYSNSNVFYSCCINIMPTTKTNMTFDDKCLENVDPKFMDNDAGDWSLRKISPCIDKGKLLGWMTSDSVDLVGNPRVFSRGKTLSETPAALPDIGCYENLHIPPGFVLKFR